MGKVTIFFCSVFHSCRCIDVFTIKIPSFTQKDPFFDKIIMQLKRFRCGIAECACVSGWFFLFYLYIFARRKVGSKSNGKLLKTEWNQFADPFFNDFVCGFDIIHLCLFDNSPSTKHNGVSKMCLFTPQSVAIGHSKWIEIEFTAIAEKRAICTTERLQWHAHSTQPNRTTSLSLSLSFSLCFFFFIECEIFYVIYIQLYSH